MKFIRYGSLKPQYHKIEDEYLSSMHTPPVVYGIYAFPHGYVEEFLLGGIGSGNLVNGRFRFLRDENGNKIKDSYVNVITEVNTHKKDNWGDYIYKKVPTKKYQELFRKQKINPNKVKAFELNSDGVNCEYVNEYKETYFVIENEPKIFEYTGNVWCHFAQYAKRNEIIKQIRHWILVDIYYYEKLLNKAIYNNKLQQAIGRKPYIEANSISGMPLKFFSKDDFEIYIEKV